MLSSYNLKNKQTIQISGLVLQYCSATTLYRRLLRAASNFPTAYVRIASQTYVLQHILFHYFYTFGRKLTICALFLPKWVTILNMRRLLLTYNLYTVITCVKVQYIFVTHPFN